jgi:thiol:disulfide interchange protein DsbC
MKIKAVVHNVILASILAASAACAAEPKLDDALRQRFPKLTFDTVQESPVKGIYEVVSGSNVFYFDPVSGHVIFGEMWSPKGISVTAEARAKISAAKYEKFRTNLSDAVKIGTGPNEVIEITDPDCPYCRKMHSYWASRKDVTRYVFLMPIAQLHPAARTKSDYILSSADQVAAFEEVMSGKYDKAQPPTVSLRKDLISRQSALVSASGLSGTPAFYVNGTFVNGANVPTIEQILNKRSN